jgi:hypothetical protein
MSSPRTTVCQGPAYNVYLGSGPDTAVGGGGHPTQHAGWDTPRTKDAQDPKGPTFHLTKPKRRQAVVVINHGTGGIEDDAPTPGMDANTNVYTHRDPESSP